MIAKNQLAIGADQFISGMASSDYGTDGALGNSSVGLNPFVVPGAMYSLAAPTQVMTSGGTAPADNIIASCSDISTGTNKRYFVGDGANFYSYNGSTITPQVSGSKTYTAGKTDLVPWSGNFYASSTTYLVQWNGTTTLHETYLAFNDGTANHPMLNYINSLYVGDGNILVLLNTTGPTWVTKLTLPPDEVIVALGIDPFTGQMLISAQKVYDYSDTLTASKFVYLYDGVSAEYTRKIPVDDLVTAFINFQGQVICGVGYNIGVWTGVGITYLRLLRNVVESNGNTDLPYKHHFAVMGRTLHIIDGPVVLTYGPVTTGKLGFFYTASEQTNTPPSIHLTCVFPAGNSIGYKLGFTYYNSGNTTYYFYTFDFGSTSAGAGILYTNYIYFPRPIYVRRVEMITTGVTTTSGIGAFTFYDESLIQANSQTLVVPSLGATASNSPQYLFGFEYTNVKLRGMQLSHTWSSQGYGVIRFVIYYDIAE